MWKLKACLQGFCCKYTNLVFRMHLTTNFKADNQVVVKYLALNHKSQIFLKTICSSIKSVSVTVQDLSESFRNIIPKEKQLETISLWLPYRWPLQVGE